MENKAIIECIKTFLKDCPYLNNANINVDYLNMNAKDNKYWSIEQVGTPRTTWSNVLKTREERQFTFIIASRCFYSPITDEQNIKNLHSFEKIAEWLKNCTEQKILPTLNSDENATKIEATDMPYLYGVDKTGTIARYEMKCKLYYEKKYSMKK